MSLTFIKDLASPPPFFQLSSSNDLTTMFIEYQFCKRELPQKSRTNVHKGCKNSFCQYRLTRDSFLWNKDIQETELPVSFFHYAWSCSARERPKL